MSADFQVAFLCSIFIVFLIEIPLNKADKKSGNVTSVINQEVVNIGGLFSLHCQRRQNRSVSCGKFRLDGYEELNAMLFAVSKINENRSLLPDVTLQVKVKDTCSSVELASKRSLNYTITKYRSKYRCSSNLSGEDRPVLAIVGERDSDISRAVTNLVGLFHIPVISYASTSSSLSGVKYFVRTVPPDTFKAQAIVDILKRFHWNYIILLYSDNEYGRFGSEEFKNRLRKETKKICIAVDETINRHDPEEEIQTWTKIQAKQSKTKVVVVFALYEDFSSFLNIGKKRHNLREYIWLSDEMWNGQTSNVTSMLGYAISVIPRQKFIQEYADFFHNSSSQHNLDFLNSFPSLKEEWFSEYRSLPSSVRGSGSNLSISNDTCLAWRSSQVSAVIDAVYSVAWALHNELQCNNSTFCITKEKNIFTR